MAGSGKNSNAPSGHRHCRLISVRIFKWFFSFSGRHRFHDVSHFLPLATYSGWPKYLFFFVSMLTDFMFKTPTFFTQIIFYQI